MNRLQKDAPIIHAVQLMLYCSALGLLRLFLK
jgi:hypothetical protein